MNNNIKGTILNQAKPSRQSKAIKQSKAIEQSKRATPYIGDDIAEYQRQNRFARSLNEANRDAQYACSIEKDRRVQNLHDMISFIIAVPFVVSLFYMAHCVIMYYK